MKENTAPLCCDGRSPLRRIAAIHDLSCFGRCALTVISPTLSAMGNQVVPLPTCLLSSHTGGFDGLYFEDTTESMRKISEHFERLNLKFDAIYTGFLGNADQIELVADFIEKFADEDTLVLVDPVMGDGGELYSTYTEELMRGMASLCKHADIITPNLTEACFLTGIPYQDTSAMTSEELSDFCRTLCDALEASGAGRTVLTGVHSGKNKLCVCTRDYSDTKFSCYIFDRIEKNYPGTGDLFASVLLGELLLKKSLEYSAHSAADFTSRVMEYSSRFPTPEREGVAFEAFLGELSGR